ncbi:MAG: ligase-associated DNA damage response DEXH box helicase, partial [Hyphomicrobiales bacterium]|nr:ligase-associated DNA damage response DEXH box helicase [Hyphomicrobiales bacterium]
MRYLPPVTKRKIDSETSLPSQFDAWFAGRGWTPRAHQLALLAQARQGKSALLIAPTGAGKTLAGFLPSLVDLAGTPRNLSGLHTLYISPLKALAVDVARNLEMPVAEMKLPVSIETRTGDTSAAKRQRQKRIPPDILLTTPEQLTLLIGSADGAHLFATLRHVVLDELHATVTSKRGDLLALALAHLRTIAPAMTTIGLSATVRDPDELRRFLVAQKPGGKTKPMASLVRAPDGAKAHISMLDTRERLPWSGHSALHAMEEIFAAIKQARLTLVFVNTRAQAEAVFQQLWSINDDNLPIALHHGSLDAGQRRKVETAMVAGRLKAVVCTSTLDLGIDWGDVDLVINVGAPKGASRIAQRIGRANHRLDEPSRALLVPANRFEVLECRAAIDAAAAGAQDTPPQRAGALDVLCQHIMGLACAAPFDAGQVYEEVTSAEPYAALSRKEFDAALQFVANGGYALGGYDRFAKIKQRSDGLWRVANPRVAQSWRMNVGTIVESDELKVRLVRARKIAMSMIAEQGGPVRSRSGSLYYPSKLAGGAPDVSKAYTGMIGRGGRVLGKIEEYFLETLAPGDTFLFGGEILALQGIVEGEALVVRAPGDAPKVPSYAGGKFPLSTYLAERVRKMLSSPKGWNALPEQVGEWLKLQRTFSALPPASGMLVETFPRGERYYLVAYPFEGRLAHQTLGMLLTRRMERMGLRPQGFVANDYALGIWSLANVGARAENGLLSMAELF